eukprot:4650584-Alexandrium_andersonii.AAC.1
MGACKGALSRAGSAPRAKRSGGPRTAPEGSAEVEDRPTEGGSSEGLRKARGSGELSRRLQEL